MEMPLNLFGLEVTYWPALLLLPLVFVGFWGSNRQTAITKAWSGRVRTSIHTRLRVVIPRTSVALGMLLVVLALADVTRAYVVTNDVLAVNRLIVTLDNSSSMYNFEASRKEPVYCADRELKIVYPRIWNACRAMDQLITATEAYAKKKSQDRQDKIAILRFGLNSFVELHPSSDYERVRHVLSRINWRDPRTGIYTEIHLALWDMYQIALQRNFRGAKEHVVFSEHDRMKLLGALTPEGFTASFHPPKAIEEKLIALRKDLRDTALIVISDAQEGQFNARLNKEPVSFIKMMQLAKFLELPVYVISIYDNNEMVRKLTSETGYGEMGGPNRGAFHLLRGEKDYSHMDEIVETILKSRFRPDSRRQDVLRVSYASWFAGAGLFFFTLGTVLAYSRFGRTITAHKGGKQ